MFRCIMNSHYSDLGLHQLTPIHIYTKRPINLQNYNGNVQMVFENAPLANIQLNVIYIQKVRKLLDLEIVAFT